MTHEYSVEVPSTSIAWRETSSQKEYCLKDLSHISLVTLHTHYINGSSRYTYAPGRGG